MIYGLVFLFFSFQGNPVDLSLFRQLMARYGEPGTRRFDNNLPVVVGWGRTNTAKDNEIKIVSTAKQQKLTAPAVGHSDCIAKGSRTNRKSTS